MRRCGIGILLVALLAGCAQTFRHVNPGHSQEQQMTDEALCEGIAAPGYWTSLLAGPWLAETMKRDAKSKCMRAKGYIEQ